MRRRSPVLNCIFVLLTGGQYGFAWLFLMASDINTEKPGLRRAPVNANVRHRVGVQPNSALVSDAGTSFDKVDTST